MGGFQNFWPPFLGAPLIEIMVYWGLYFGSSFFETPGGAALSDVI